MNEENLLAEKQQIINHWNKRILSNERRCINNYIQMERICRNEYCNMDIRRLHDKFGFMAKDDLNKGGICAGAIYRTENFINVPVNLRTGSSKPSPDKIKVHIEHTIPINSLAHAIAQKHKMLHYPDKFLAWILKYSVVTAMLQNQIVMIHKGQANNFINNLEDGSLSFSRYDIPPNGGGNAIWDVWNGELINSNHFTFRHHVENIISILQECQESADLIAYMEDNIDI